MASSVSNDNGRALEFAVTRQLDLGGATLTATAQHHQAEYKKYFDIMVPKLKSEFIVASERIVKWVDTTVSTVGSTVDKSLDSDPGVADVLVTAGSKMFQSLVVTR